MATFRTVLRVLLALASVASPIAALAQPCQCIDIGDIKARSAEAQTAMKAYGDEITKMTEQIQRMQTPIAYTPDRRAKLQGRVQEALNKNASGRISTAPTMGDNPGGTDNLCNTTINIHPAATACMRESVRRHEELHRQECLKTRTAGKIATTVQTGQDRFERDGVQLMTYAYEEIQGYQTEVMFLSQEQARLEQACKPKPPPVRDYTAEQRNRSPAGQQPDDPAKSGLDAVRKRLGF
jgi:TolA-binding protein